jgi:dTDP-D-glucose 4,6-dehydratase
MRDVDRVFHFATQIDEDRPMIEPRMLCDVDLLSALNTLAITRFFDGEKVIHASTNEVHGVRLMLVHHGLLTCIFSHDASSAILLAKVPL